jgi:hypothetical protein
MPCNILPCSCAVLILDLSSSAVASILSLKIQSGLTGLLLLPLLLEGGVDPFLLPLEFPWVRPWVRQANGTRMYHSLHVLLGTFPLLWAGMLQTLGCLFPQLSAVHTLPRRLIGQIFLCLASCVTGTCCERHHLLVVLTSLTSSALVPSFALSRHSLTEVLSSSLTAAAAKARASSSTTLLMTSHGTLLSDVSQFAVFWKSA